MALLVGTLQGSLVAIGWYFLYHVTHERIADGVEDIIVQNNERMALTLLETIGQLGDELAFGGEEWERVQRIIERAEFAGGGFACILDRQGAIVCHPELRDNPALRELTLAQEPFRERGTDRELQLAELDSEGMRSGEMRFLFDGKHYIATTVMDDAGFRLLVHQPVSGLTAASQHVTAGLVVIIAAVGGGVVALTMLGVFVLTRRHDRTLVAWNESLDRKVNQRTRQLEDALEQVHVAMQARDQFLANLSHEFRTPMNGVLGTLHLLRELGLDDEQLKLADTIERSGETLLELLGRLLEYSRLISEDGELETEELDPRELLESCVQSIRREAWEKNLTLTTAFAPDVPHRVHGEPVLVRRALENLLENAVTYTEQGGVEVHVELAPTAEDDDGAAERTATLCFVVTDTGAGIPDEALAELFEPFRQGDSTASRRHQGVGLGLATAREIARRLGGTLTVRSEVGRGSSFRLEVPFRLAVGATAAD